MERQKRHTLCLPKQQTFGKCRQRHSRGPGMREVEPSSSLVPSDLLRIQSGEQIKEVTVQGWLLSLWPRRASFSGPRLDPIA